MKQPDSWVNRRQPEFKNRGPADSLLRGLKSGIGLPWLMSSFICRSFPTTSSGVDAFFGMLRVT